MKRRTVAIYTLPYPPMVELARLRTPVSPLERLSEEVGTTLLCKRDDLTGAALSGNKVRKLEFLISDALTRGCDRVITWEKQAWRVKAAAKGLPEA